MKQKNINKLTELENPIKAKNEIFRFIYKRGEKLPKPPSGTKVALYLPYNGRRSNI